MIGLSKKIAPSLAVLAITCVAFSVFPATSQAVDSNTTSSTSAAAPAPVKRDNQIPTITSIKFVTSGDAKAVTIDLQLDARIHINVIDSIAIGIALKGAAIAPINPLFADKCTALKGFSAVKSPSNGGEIASLQKRIVSGDGFLETHVLRSVTTANANEDICAGEYVLSSISLKDAAAHTLILSATTAVTTSGKNSITANASMSSNVWADGTAANMAAGFAAYPCSQIPGAAISARVICNQSITMGQSIFIVKGGTTAITPLNSAQKIVDYQVQLEPIAAENKDLKRQIEMLNARLTEIEKIRNKTSDTSTTVAIVDYQASAKALQIKVDQLSKQISTLKSNLAKAKSGKTIAKPKATPKPTPKATSRKYSGSGGNYNGNSSNGNSNSKITPNPNAKSTWKPSPSPTKR